MSCNITLHVQDAASANLSVGGGNSATLSIGAEVIGGGIAYEGEYEVTPSAETQTLPTEARVLGRDITIAPIPSNYGLITWNGSVLTVS